MTRVEATLSLGANLGDPKSTMAAALVSLDAVADVRVSTVSRLYRTPPWGPVEQPPFINCCALVATTLAPDALMQLCLDIEKRLKRVRDVRWGPRVIDIDILTYGTEVIHTPLVTVPHPRMTERGFVLVPLAEIAPELRVLGRTIRDWLSATDVTGIEPLTDDGHWWR